MKPIVVKRDGSRVKFDAQRIENAVKSAAIGCRYFDDTLAPSVTNAVVELLDNSFEVQIDDIQTMVETELMKQAPFVARCYIEYRHDRDAHREKRSLLNTDIKGLVDQSNAAILNENANKDSKVIPVQRDLLAGIMSKHYAQTHMLPRDIVAAHKRGEIHYHDLDYAPLFPSFNCMIVDLNDMLSKGFLMGNAEIDSPRSIQTATAVTAQIVAQVASHTYGGTTLDRLDEVLAPYVERSYEKHFATAKEYAIPDAEAYAEAMTEKDCYDAFQSLEYEINTLFSSNGQTPFLSIGFGLGTSKEARLIQQAILKIRIDGLGKSKKTAIFPKLIYTLKDGTNLKPTDPNYDVKKLALECASKRMYPDVINYDKVVEVTGSFKAPMGCRSFLNAWRNDEGEFEHAGRNNLGVVSLNLPRIAIEAKGNEAAFYDLLDQRMRLARKALETRIDRFRGVKASVAPILYTEGACGVRLKPDDDVIELFKHGRASISLGYIGIHETMLALYGNDSHVFDQDELREKAQEIVSTLRNAVDEWKRETGWGFSLYATPSENLCSRFCKLDTKEFGMVPGVTEKGYYTNSFHLDVEKKVNPFDKIDFEMAFPPISNGGFICYGEFPNMQNNIEALEKVWDYSYERVPYYGTNTPIDECYECDFTGEFDCTSKGFSCPKCGNTDSAKLSVTRRVCGYLGSPESRPFNDGKQEEVIRRIKHL